MKIKTGGWVARLILLFVFVFQCQFIIRPLALKVVREYPHGMLDNVMPWQIEDYNGWTFIASEEGLIQFDGAIPELFPLNNRRPLRSVNFDKDEQRLYAGGISEFGYFLPSISSSLEYVCLSDSVGNDRYIGNIWGIFPHDGTITVQGDAAIINYDTNTGKHERINSDFKLDCSAWIDGVLWLGTDDGLKFLMGKNIVDAPGASLLKDKRIRSILNNGEGLIIVTADGVWDYKNEVLIPMKNINEKITVLGEIFSAALNDNILAIGSISKGLVVIDLEKEDSEFYDEDTGLNSNTVISLKFDDSGNLWTGMQYGLAKILLNLPVERLENNSMPVGSGYVTAAKDGKLYLGTNRGLFTIDYNLPDPISKTSLLPVHGMQGQVWGLATIGNDLFCCHDRGLFLIDQNIRSKEIGDLNGVWDIQRIIGSPNRAYIGTYNGFYIATKTGNDWNVNNHFNGYYSSAYNFVQESPTVIWTDDGEEGVKRLTVDTVNYKITDIKTFTVASDGFPLTADVFLSRIDNDIFFSTSNGIYTFDKTKEIIVKDKEITKLLETNGEIRRLKKTNGSIYALTPNEIIQADPAGILPLRRIPISPSLAKPMGDKDIFFPIGGDYIAYPSRKGYLFFDFSGKNDSLYHGFKPSARINNIRVTSNGDSVVYRGNYANAKYEPLLNYEDNSLRIEFGSPEAVERGTLYSTRINNEPWSAPSPVIAKEYTDLHEGKYYFQVKAITPNGENELDYFSFKVAPPWWRTKWMWIIYALSMFALTFLFIRLEQQRVKRKEAGLILEKDAELARRQKIHDEETEEKDRQIMLLEREKLDKELRHKAQEVANVMMNLSHKNETLSTVKKELQDILPLISKDNAEARKAILNLQSKVTVDIRSDEILKRVEEEFDIIHDNFMKRLRARFPSLTNNEVLLCAYLKMNLSSKEIAPLLNISPRGVETMRYRLRKKLNLDRDSNLSDFLSKLE